MDMASVASATPISGRPKRRLSSRNMNASGYGAAVANGAYATVANIVRELLGLEMMIPGQMYWRLSGTNISSCVSEGDESMGCGNRIIQRGITRKLQKFFTHEGKGWEALYTGATTCRGFCVRIRKGDTD
ncbi:hypothetical protein R1sor_008129 [Riccia sorocarpa]|uniref:Uncharacterized protein n=1 Tax=Riccia sorocarpa TaxID=122646 RepID=A0ABD3HSU8_9MARC